MSFSRLLLILLACVCPAVALASPVVYPVKEVIGFDTPSLERTAPAFAGWVKDTGLPRLSAEFVADIMKEFGSLVVGDIDAANKHRVLVASLNLVRASQYEVPKRLSRCTEYQLPITLSLVFTNPVTGDVVYSFTDTSYAPVVVNDSESADRRDSLLREANAANYDKLLAMLVSKAKKGYNPTQIEASVARIWKGLYILNKGSKAGIARDDNLVDADQNEIQVRYATEDYAVAVPLLVSSVAVGQQFAKYADQSISKTVKKPKVLSLSGNWGDDQLASIARYFDSELSKESAFTLLPVNDGFSRILSSLAKETNLGQFQGTNQRALPDYLLKFSYSEPRIYAVNQRGKFGFQIYEQYVIGELLDTHGRVVYSAVASDKIEDKNVAGMIFSRDARLEIVLKNAVKRMAEQFSQSIKFVHSVLPITSVDANSISLEDTARQLRSGDTIQVYRNIGRVTGINGDVLVPIWSADVAETSAGVVRAGLVAPSSNEVNNVKVSKNDVVVIDAITAPTGSASAPERSSTSVTYCNAESSKLGALDIADFKTLSRGFGYLLPYALYEDDPAFSAKVLEVVKYGGFSASTLKLGQMDTGGRCLLPVYKASLAHSECTDGACEAVVQLAAGFRLISGAKKVGSSATETKLSLTEVAEPALESIVQSEVDKNVLGLLKDNISKVRYK